MNVRTASLFAAAALLASCHQPQSAIGSNIAEAHDNAADAIDNQADAFDNKAETLHNEADATRKWGKDLKKEADRITKDGGHPDETALNQM